MLTPFCAGSRRPDGAAAAVGQLSIAARGSTGCRMNRCAIQTFARARACAPADNWPWRHGLQQHGAHAAYKRNLARLLAPLSQLSWRLWPRYNANLSVGGYSAPSDLARNLLLCRYSAVRREVINSGRKLLAQSGKQLLARHTRLLHQPRNTFFAERTF